MRALAPAASGNPDQNGLGQGCGRDIDFHFHRHRFDTQQRIRIQFGQHAVAPRWPACSFRVARALCRFSPALQAPDVWTRTQGDTRLSPYVLAGLLARVALLAGKQCSSIDGRVALRVSQQCACGERPLAVPEPTHPVAVCRLLVPSFSIDEPTDVNKKVPDTFFDPDPSVDE